MRCTSTQKQDFHKPNLELTVFWKHKMTFRTLMTISPNHKTTLRTNPFGLISKKENKTKKNQQQRQNLPRTNHESPSQLLENLQVLTVHFVHLRRFNNHRNCGKTWIIDQKLERSDPDIPLTNMFMTVNSAVKL